MKLTQNEKDIIYIVQLFLYYIVFAVANIKNIVKWKKERKNAKKKLVYTARVKRLIFFTFIALIVIIFSVMEVGYSGTSHEMFLLDAYAKKILVYSLLIYTMPIVLIFGAIFAFPTETLINDHYINSARFKILRPKYKNLIRIGITGSYGKTSTKFILKTILSEKYNVLATPESYNTTMGNVKVIREELKPEHEILISEMGARYRGDISKICDFVYPQIGMITSIGPQHLESFKTVENVAKTKSELIRAIPKRNEMNLTNMYGVADKSNQKKCAIFLPSDGSFCSKLYQEEKERNKFSYGINDKNASVYAKDIKMSAKGSEFIAVTSIGEIKCVSKLLGELNIQNILGAIAIAVFLGLSKEQIARGISKIEAVEHRLQIIPNANGSVVIDDAFNSNPEGSKMALEVLKNFEGRKIIITPGMVELGAKEVEYNKEFGRHMAKCVDIAILVGIKRSRPIEEGLLENGFDNMNIHVVTNLEEATRKLAMLTMPGDVILFENDLPDNYNE
ncbi:MAG: UDP-N-acetylmuramoyl-tripeptide--D-alanyl-D-alanine ligase [Clostridia bacterium]|nr:UDP-N-acetylmuramoyl-tripeptide--D-alanyl-D-alanine ligase [Clostridia bacterium]